MVDEYINFKLEATENVTPAIMAVRNQLKMLKEDLGITEKNLQDYWDTLDLTRKTYDDSTLALQRYDKMTDYFSKDVSDMGDITRQTYEDSTMALMKYDEEFSTMMDMSERWPMALLGVMFAGQRLAKTFGFLGKQISDVYFAGELLNIQFTMMAAVEPFLEPLIEGFYWLADIFYDLPEPIQGAMGVMVLFLEQVGNVMDWIGTLGLAAWSLDKYFKVPFKNITDIITGTASTGAAAMTGMLTSIGTTAMAILPWVIIAGLLISSIMSQTGDLVAWENKVNLAKMEGDWNNYTLFTIAKTIEQRHLIPKIFADMAFTIGSIMHDLQLTIRNTLVDARRGALQLWALIPGQEEIAAQALTKLEMEHQTFLKNWAEERADKTRGYLITLQEIRRETATEMARMEIPLEDIIDVYGEVEGVIGDLFTLAREGTIDMDELNAAMLEHWDLTEDTSTSLDDLKTNFLETTTNIIGMKDEISNNITEMDLFGSSIDDVIAGLLNIPKEVRTKIIVEYDIPTVGGVLGDVPIPSPTGLTPAGYNVNPYGTLVPYYNPADVAAANLDTVGTMGDFIVRPGQKPMAFSPDDTVVGFKKGGMGQAINFSPTINISATLNNPMDMKEVGRQLMDGMHSELRRRMM